MELSREVQEALCNLQEGTQKKALSSGFCHTYATHIPPETAIQSLRISIHGDSHPIVETIRKMKRKKTFKTFMVKEESTRGEVNLLYLALRKYLLHNPLTKQEEEVCEYFKASATYPRSVSFFQYIHHFFSSTAPSLPQQDVNLLTASFISDIVDIGYGKVAHNKLLYTNLK